jgi:hypothetical protein
VLVVCGGYSEDAYLRGLARQLDNRSLELTLRVHPAAPAQVVAYARRLADRAEAEFDEVWCVVDVDDFDVEAGRSTAARLKVRLVVSNPCFELWLLLHFEDYRGHLARCREAELALKKHLPGYRKAKPMYPVFAAGLDHACKRARSLESDGSSSPNPSTGMWRLVARIVGESE